MRKLSKNSNSKPRWHRLRAAGFTLFEVVIVLITGFIVVTAILTAPESPTKNQITIPVTKSPAPAKYNDEFEVLTIE